MKEKIELKFSLLWPSSKTTPPTEANITATFIELFSDNYHCYSEVPIRGGRVDLVLLEKSQNEIVYCEFKSSKKSSLDEIMSDIDRLLILNIQSFFFYTGRIPTETKRVIFQWSENQEEIDHNLRVLNKKYKFLKAQKFILSCDGSPLYCLYSIF